MKKFIDKVAKKWKADAEKQGKKSPTRLFVEIIVLIALSGFLLWSMRF